MTGKQYIIPLLVALLLTCTASVQGQELSNWRVRTMAVTDTLVLDTMSLVPGSFVMEDGNDNIIPMSAYRLDEAKGILTWSRKSTLDSVVVRFKVFPVNFAQTRFKKDARVIERSIAETANPFVYNPFSAESSGPGFGGLNYSGGFSRGISFGNNQDLVPTSDLNLQLSGKLNDVQIVAAITDQNIPSG